MTQLIRNYIALGGSLDTKLADNVTIWDIVFAIFMEYAQWVSKVTCYDRLSNLLQF